MRIKKVRALSLGAIAVLVLAACTGGDTVAAGGEGDEPAATDETQAEETAAQETPSGPFLFDLSTGEATPLPKNLSEGDTYVASPDGARLAFAIKPFEPGGVFEVATLDGADVQTIEPDEDLVVSSGARWSPDGSMLVYQEVVGLGDLGNLFVHDLASEERAQLTDLEPPSALVERFWISASFSPDGREVIFHLPRNGSETTKFDAWSVPVTGGEPQIVLRSATFPLYLPDGKEIAFVRRTSSMGDGWGNRLVIASADGSGSPRILSEANDTIWWPAISPDGTAITYATGGSIYMVDIATGQTSQVTEGGQASWVDTDTLVVAP